MKICDICSTKKKNIVTKSVQHIANMSNMLFFFHSRCCSCCLWRDNSMAYPFLLWRLVAFYLKHTFGIGLNFSENIMISYEIHTVQLYHNCLISPSKCSPFVAFILLFGFFLTKLANFQELSLQISGSVYSCNFLRI